MEAFWYGVHRRVQFTLNVVWWVTKSTLRTGLGDILLPWQGGIIMGIMAAYFRKQDAEHDPPQIRQRVNYAQLNFFTICI